MSFDGLRLRRQPTQTESASVPNANASATRPSINTGMYCRNCSSIAARTLRADRPPGKFIRAWRGARVSKSVQPCVLQRLIPAFSLRGKEAECGGRRSNSLVTQLPPHPGPLPLGGGEGELPAVSQCRWRRKSSNGQVPAIAEPTAPPDSLSSSEGE